jgi:hypothetical protein
MALLWISLICMIPFDFSQFDDDGKEGHTAIQIESLAKRSLTNSGIVRESAAILLSRFYVRYRTHQVPHIVLLKRILGGMYFHVFLHFWIGQRHVPENRKISLRYIHMCYKSREATHSVLLPVSRHLSDALRGCQE